MGGRSREGVDSHARGPLEVLRPHFSEPQTLNLTEGGQGGYEYWESLVSRSARQWRTVKEKIETYLQTPQASGGGGGTLQKVKYSTTFPLSDGTTFFIGCPAQ